MKENEFNQLEGITQNLQNELNSKLKEVSNLTSLRIKGLIDDSEYKTSKDELSKELEEIKKSLDKVESRMEKWNQITEKAFEFVAEAKQAFLKGDKEAKKQILLFLGSNYKLIDRKVFIEPYSWLVPIEKANS